MFSPMEHSGTCTICGKLFTRDRPLRGSTCSAQCRGIARQKKTAIKKTCPVCNEIFERQPSYRAKHCSIQCFNRRGQRKPDMDRLCEYCAKPYKRMAGQIKRRFCSRHCATMHLFGEKQLKLKITKRTNLRAGNSIVKATLEYKKAFPWCQRCGWKEEPAILHVHHKDRNRFNKAPSNFETLCPTCHVLEHYRAKDGIWLNIKKRAIS